MSIQSIEVYLDKTGKKAKLEVGEAAPKATPTLLIMQALTAKDVITSKPSKTNIKAPSRDNNRIRAFVILIVIEKRAKDKSIRKIKIEKFLFLKEFSYSKKTENITNIII